MILNHPIKTISTPRNLVLIATAAILTGCTSAGIDIDRRGDYTQTSAGKNLVIPPKISRYSNVGDALQVDQSANTPQVNPNVPNATLMGEGLKRWVRIQAPADIIYARLEDFWASQGFTISQSQPAIGIMQTDWLEVDNKGPGVLGQVLASLQSAPFRDRYRTRVEQGAEGTDIFITHEGQQSSGGRYGWVDDGSNAELEIEMLRKLMIYLGYGEAQAEQLLANAKVGENVDPVIAKMARLDGQTVLAVREPYDEAWQTVGFALEGLGFNIIQKDYNQGTYQIEKQPNGWFENLTSSTQRYRIGISDQGSQTAVGVLSESGELRQDSDATQFLEAILEQLNP